MTPGTVQFGHVESIRWNDTDENVVAGFDLCAIVGIGEEFGVAVVPGSRGSSELGVSE